MTEPKRHEPGQVAFITQRTTQGIFFLRPGKDTREVVGYFYGHALNEEGLVAHGACTMSNHEHTVISDPHARRSKFMQRFHSGVARVRNKQLGREENLWTSRDPGDTALLDLQVIVDKLVYTFLQPVAANCVETVGEWTGFQILPRDWGKPMRFKRPKHCSSAMPEYVEFTPQPPPGFEDKPLEEVIAYFERLILEEEDRYRRERTSPVLGIKYCESLDPFTRPASPSSMHGMNPRFSATNIEALTAAIRRQRQFRQEHLACLRAMQAGRRDVKFPSGTIKMAQVAGVETKEITRGDPYLPLLEWTDSLQKSWEASLQPA